MCAGIVKMCCSFSNQLSQNFVNIFSTLWDYHKSFLSRDISNPFNRGLGMFCCFCNFPLQSCKELASAHKSFFSEYFCLFQSSSDAQKQNFMTHKSSTRCAIAHIWNLQKPFGIVFTFSLCSDVIRLHKDSESGRGDMSWEVVKCDTRERYIRALSDPLVWPRPPSMAHIISCSQ